MAPTSLPCPTDSVPAWSKQTFESHQDHAALTNCLHRFTWGRCHGWAVLTVSCCADCFPHAVPWLQVWVKPEMRDDGKIYWKADSDSQLTKGLAALLVMGLSGWVRQYTSSMYSKGMHSLVWHLHSHARLHSGN